MDNVFKLSRCADPVMGEQSEFIKVYIGVDAQHGPTECLEIDPPTVSHPY